MAKEHRFRPVVYHAYSAFQEEPLQSFEIKIKWQEQNYVWLVKRLTEVWDNRAIDEKRGCCRKWVIDFESFKVNVPVNQKLFEINSLSILEGVPFTFHDAGVVRVFHGGRFFNRPRPQ